jgi:aminoglycoside 6'-N-acetyltransferase
MSETTSSSQLPPRLQGERVAIRAPGPGELERLACAIAADPQASPWWGTDHIAVRSDLLDEPDYRVLVIEHNGDAVGVIAFEEETHPNYHSASIDITLLECCVDQGLGTRALRLLIEWLIGSRGHHRITIDPALANTRAIHAYRKVGFRPVGIMRAYERGPDGTYHDSLLMDLLAEEYRAAPE